VTYVVDTTEDSARAGTVGDHAYWVSRIRLRSGARGTVDVRSLGFGSGDPAPEPVSRSAGVLEGGSRGPAPYVHRVRSWSPAPREQRRDKLVVRTTNVRSLTIDAARARVSCDPEIELEADGPVNVRVSCSR
jgi:hypothetical protein